MFGPRYSLTQGQKLGKLIYLYSIGHKYQLDTKVLTNDLFVAYISCNYTSVKYLESMKALEKITNHTKFLKL